jgi:hypothetical protein
LKERATGRAAADGRESAASRRRIRISSGMLGMNR